MIVDDFHFDPVTGKFTEADATSFIGDVVLRLSMKRRSNEKFPNGISVYPGDFFFDPNMGNNNYEVHTITNENIRILKSNVDAALKPLISQKKVAAIATLVTPDVNDVRRVNIDIEIKNNDGTTVSYQYFYEVT